MVGKCYGIGQSGEYFYAWSTTNGNGLGWVKNAKTGDLSAYVPMAGTTQEAPITGLSLIHICMKIIRSGQPQMV